MKRITHTSMLIFAALKEQVKGEKAYLGSFWFAILSRVSYNLMFLLFIDVLFQRVPLVAGYDRNDFMFMYFISQIGFYLTYGIIYTAMLRLIDTVRNGNFDLLLLKPVPHRAFLYIGGQRPIELFFALVTTLPLVATQIQWGSLHMTPSSLVLGIVVWICGFIICNTLMFALTMPVFKAGDATDMASIFFSITTISTLPYSALPETMRVLSLCIIPHILIAAGTAEVMLSKSDSTGLIMSALIATVISVLLYQFLWRYALRNYTSASS